jgi:protein-disulfide isomerase
VRFIAALSLLALAATLAVAEPDRRPGELTIVESHPTGPYPTLGPALAPVTIEFFCNLGDGNKSANMHYLLAELAERHPQRLRVVYRLTNRTEAPNPGLEFGQEAFHQGRFFPFLEAYYGTRRRHPRPEEYEEVAKAAGVDFLQVQKARDSGRHDRAIADNYYYAQRRRLHRNPGLLINGEPASGRLSSIGELESLYDKAYSDALDVMARGISPEDLYEYMLARIDAEKMLPALVGGPVDHTEPGDEPPAIPRKIPMNGLIDPEFATGPESAEVTAIFLCHFQSSYCGTMARRLRDIQRSYPDELRIVFHPLFNTSFEGQQQAGLLQEAALCAREQGAFWDYYQEIFKRVRVRNVDLDYVVERAKAIELNTETFSACLHSERYTQKVSRQLKAAEKLGVHHTPSLIVGGTLYSGRLHLSEIQQVIDAELAPGILARWTSPNGR